MEFSRTFDYGRLFTCKEINTYSVLLVLQKDTVPEEVTIFEIYRGEHNYLSHVMNGKNLCFMMS